MKRVLFSMLAFAAVAMSTLFVGCKEEEPTRALESDVVVYLDGKQVLDKSGLLEQVAPMMGLIAENVAMEFEAADQQFVKAVMDNLDNTGITFSKPFYINVNIDEFGEPENAALIAKVNNSGDVDHLLELLGVEAEREGGDRIFSLDGAVAGYNNSRLVVAVSDSESKSYDYLKHVLSSADEDLSIFGKRDIGIYANAHTIMELIKNSNIASIQSLEMYGFEGEVEELEAQNRQIDDYMSTMEPDAYLLAGLAFEPGRIVLDMDVEGFPDNNNLAKKVSNDNLAYIPGTTWAVANLGVNGAALAEQLSTLITPELLGVEDGGELGMVMSIVEDVVSSFAGDITIALNNYREGYYGSVVDAIAMIDVKDDYIINNLATYAPFMGVELEREGKNQYSLSVDYANSLYIGQTKDTFYVGVNSIPEALSNSAARARWYGDVNNTYGYVVVDANNLIKKFRDDLQVELGYQAMEIVDMLDYAYLSFPTTKTFELALALKDKHTNSLEQIADLVMAVVGDDLVGEVFSGMLDGMDQDEYDYYDYEEELYEDDYDFSEEELSEEDLELLLELLGEMEDFE